MRVERLFIALGIATGLCGCIHHVYGPATTQPFSQAALATTVPYYWLDQPAIASASASDFDRVWAAAADTMRDDLFELDRTDYRTGLLTSKPMISRQWFEPWRKDAGTSEAVWQSSVGTIRRTVRVEITRNNDDTFTAMPKILVERQTILERRITNVGQYRSAFIGPTAGPTATAQQSVQTDEADDIDIPVKYWTPIGRDEPMEKKFAAAMQRHLDRGK